MRQLSLLLSARTPFWGATALGIISPEGMTTPDSVVPGSQTINLIRKRRQYAFCQFVI